MLRGWLIMVALVAVGAEAAEVREVSGTVIHIDDSGKEHNLGPGRQPVLSPDGSKVAFIRGESDEADEIWLWNGAAPPYRLQVRASDSSPRRNLEGFNGLLFSEDGQSLYFLSLAWVTSDALHVIPLRGGKARFITDANDVILAPVWLGRGRLLVQRHRYPSAGGGATDDYWLITGTGKVVRHIGDEAAVDKLLKSRSR